MVGKQSFEFEKVKLWHSIIMDCHFIILQRNSIAIIQQLDTLPNINCPNLS